MSKVEWSDNCKGLAENIASAGAATIKRIEGNLAKEALQPYAVKLRDRISSGSGEGGHFGRKTGRLSATGHLKQKHTVTDAKYRAISNRSKILAFFYIKDQAPIVKKRSAIKSRYTVNGRTTEKMIGAKVANTSDYQAFLEFGTRPHKITSGAVRDIRGRRDYFYRKIAQIDQYLASGLYNSGRKISKDKLDGYESKREWYYVKIADLQGRDKIGGGMVKGVRPRYFQRPIRKDIAEHAPNELFKAVQENWAKALAHETNKITGKQK